MSYILYISYMLWIVDIYVIYVTVSLEGYMLHILLCGAIAKSIRTVCSMLLVPQWCRLTLERQASTSITISIIGYYIDLL